MLILWENESDDKALLCIWPSEFGVHCVHTNPGTWRFVDRWDAISPRKSQNHRREIICISLRYMGNNEIVVDFMDCNGMYATVLYIDICEILSRIAGIPHLPGGFVHSSFESDTIFSAPTTTTANREHRYGCQRGQFKETFLVLVSGSSMEL